MQIHLAEMPPKANFIDAEKSRVSFQSLGFTLLQTRLVALPRELLQTLTTGTETQQLLLPSLQIAQAISKTKPPRDFFNSSNTGGNVQANETHVTKSSDHRWGWRPPHYHGLAAPTGFCIPVPHGTPCLVFRDQSIKWQLKIKPWLQEVQTESSGQALDLKHSSVLEMRSSGFQSIRDTGRVWEARVPSRSQTQMPEPRSCAHSQLQLQATTVLTALY